MTTFFGYNRIKFRPLEESDYPTLYKWRNELDFLSLFSPRRNIVNYEKFVSEQKLDTERTRHLQFIGESISKNIPLGTIYSYNLNMMDGNVFIGGYADKDFRGVGYGAISCALFVTYLFRFFNLHKIYFDVLGYNEPSISMLQNFNFVEEGRFKGHRFYNGEYHDLIRFAVYRDGLSKIHDFVSRLEKRNQLSSQ